MSALPDDLSRTRTLFEQWRATRSGREKIPEPLWQAVVALHGRYSASQLCRELHLSAGALRSRLPKGTAPKSSSRPAFVALPAADLTWSTPPLPTTEEIRLVWERADGTRLHLSLPTSQGSQAEALCISFLGS
jgi:hypothetical protein